MIKEMDRYEKEELRKAEYRWDSLDRESLLDRKAGRDEYASLLKDPKDLNRILGYFFDNLCNGCCDYGDGPKLLLEDILKDPNKRINKVSRISQLVAAFECQCPRRYALDAYVLQLTQPERDAANELFKSYIKKWEEEQ
tara:strand:- start:174 stop:590 length:417 start_codon:yes stop_codon:yes gene_type:complete